MTTRAGLAAASALAAFAVAMSPAAAALANATPSSAAPAAPKPTVAATRASRCAHPNIGARTLHAVAPEVPREIAHFGVGGQVVVVVSLATDGHVLGARVAGASSRFLESTALAAARASKFAPAVRNCVPVGAAYTFVVDYAPPTQLPEQHADPLTYFPGAWRCTSTGGSARTLTFTRNASGLSETDGSATTWLALDRYHIWRIHRNGHLVGWAFPWVDDAWTWSAGGTDTDVARYESDDDTTFTLTTFAGTVSAHEQPEKCTRTSPSP